MAVHTAPSSTVVIDTMSPAAVRASNGLVPTRATAAPSTNWSTWSSVTGAPLASAATSAAAPAGSTPSTEVVAVRSARNVVIPLIQPPPPTGTMTVSGSAPSWSRISTAMVPWPAIVRTSSYGGTSVAPVRATSSRAASAAMS